MMQQATQKNIYYLHMQKVKQLTEKMLASAEQGEWGEVEDFDVIRVDMLKKHGPLPSAEADIARSAELVGQILEMNERLVFLGRQQRDTYSTERQSLGRGRQAVAAYGG
jgi:hypothetical protein